ncbi:MAG: uracil-DNA glycosylase [Bacteroidetes bacterium]|nr:uracil-DNA glycosylase [Rhodothermia bacterium]MCS7154724.1 uracil-DNA glycosylase [Bacteroidota bacterium]MCX7907119.1 uracil-DNA glycosylase [Bacteroidota bacterium]MDW8137517.1 uracil-DNA glycosylase [Bacteroidota bacterium]MDW8285529.1 uracil-DNA glycosylase [Bacteroidota bacterium]
MRAEGELLELLRQIRAFLAYQVEVFGPELLCASAKPAQPSSSEGASKGNRPADPWEALGEALPEALRGIRDLETLEALVRPCTQCRLARTRRHVVFGTGNPQARLVLVGEAPGADEDATGVPFVGKAGQLLDRILAAIGFTRHEVYICNVLKCRPPYNRDPEPEEVAACRPYLLRQLDLIRPRLILALGRHAATALLQTTEPLSQLRGRLHPFYGAEVVVTYHPAALLRNPGWKRLVWEDVQLLRRRYDELIGS